MNMLLKEKWQRPEYELHRLDIKRRGISLAQAVERGYEPLTADETYTEIHQSVGSTIAITCLTANGKPRKHRRFRLLDQVKIAKRDQRYTQGKDTGVLPHFRHPKKPNQQFKRWRVITEGEIKADEIAEHIGVPTISVPGIDCFRKDGKLHPAIANLEWSGWTAELAYDSDQAKKPHVRKSLLELADLLARLNADVKIREFADLADGRKAGADDIIREHGTEGYLNSPLHDLDSPTIRQWRDHAKKPSSQSLLPTVLHNLQPVAREWYDEKPPAAEYIVDPLWQTGESALFVGQAGVGKSYLLLNMLAAIGSGTQFFDFTVPKPRKALYLMCERHEANLRRRWHKVTHAKAATLDAGPQNQFKRLIHQNCFLKAIAGDSLALIEHVGQQWQPSPVVDALITELRAADITVLFFDPLSRLHGGDENDASVAAAITKALERIVQQANCSVMVVHHTGKQVNGGMHSGRGSSVFNDNTSETIVMTLVTGDERSKLDLRFLATDEAQYDVIKMHHARCSDGAPAPDTYFLRDGRTGLPRQIRVSHKAASDHVQELLTDNPRFHKWASGRRFTKTEMTKARAVISPQLSEVRSKELFDGAVAAGIFVENGQRQGYPLYEWAPRPERPVKIAQLSSAARHYRTTAPLKRARQSHAR